jgi:hypothetical protein
LSRADDPANRGSLNSRGTAMQVKIRRIEGDWDDGYALAKHSLSSVYRGENEFGHPQYDTTRSEPGEALYQLKFRSDWSQARPLAFAIAQHIVPRFDRIDIIVRCQHRRAACGNPSARSRKHWGT